MSADWINKHRDLYLKDGKAGHMWDSGNPKVPGPVPTLLLYTRGRKSGKTSIMPLIYGKAENGYLVIASNGGALNHPDWYFNLSAQPEIEIKLVDEHIPLIAETVTGERRSALWEKMVSIWPDYASYQQKTKREIPVVLLKPR